MSVYSDYYFVVMDLGMCLSDMCMRNFVSIYLWMVVYFDFDFGGEDYDFWFKSVKSFELFDIVVREIF